MTVSEFRQIYREREKLVLRPKSGLNEIQIGSYIMPVRQDEYRAVVEKTTIFVYQKGKSRYGFRAWDDEQILKQFNIVYIDKNKKWQKRLDRAIKAMENSGLWPDLLETMKDLKKMAYEDKKEICDLTWSEEYRKSVHNNDKLNVEEYNGLFTSFFSKWINRYPFIFTKDENGKLYYKTVYLWEMSDCELKSMYFGKYYNVRYKDEIKNAIKNKEAISRNARSSYDVSFSYDPEKCRAWYSEEYKNCGNGHYYLALDHNTALFCEND